MMVRNGTRPVRGPAAAKARTLRAAASGDRGARNGTTAGARPGRALALPAAALAGMLALAGCFKGGGSASGGSASGGGEPRPADVAQAVSQLRFDYTLDGAGEAPVAETGSVSLSCPAAGCAAADLRELEDHAGAGTRGGLGTVTGTTGGPPLTAVVPGGSATVSEATFTRHGLWGAHGWAAVEIGAGMLSAEAGGRQWSGSFRAAHAWTGGEATGSNPSGTGSAAWRGVAEAADAATFERLEGTAVLRIADLSRPLVDVDVDLDDGGAGVELRWTGMRPSGGTFAKGTAGADRIDGRFHGPEHQEAWGVFDTATHVGAFGAKREP